MPNILSIFRREFGAYFNSAIAYIFIIVFLLVNSILYMSSFFLAQNVDMRAFFGIMPMILVVFLPAVTMRLWAEDKKSGTIELLMTFPMPAWQVVLGKFLAGYLFFLIALAGTFPIPLMLNLAGNPDMGPVYGGYFGTALMGAFYLSLGIFISGVSKDQIVAFIVAMVACFIFFITGTDFISMQIDGWIPGLGTFLANYIGLAGHFESIERGILDLKDIAYFLSLAVLFLFLNGLSLQDRYKPGARMKFAVNMAVMAALAVFFQVVMGGVQAGRFDLTEDKIFSVSPAGLEILSRLKAPVQVKYYVSPREKMPSQFKNLEEDVTGKLEEYRLASNGILNYEVVRAEGIGQFEEKIDKEKEGEDIHAKLGAKGIQPFQVQTLENDEMAIKVIYSALSIGYKEKKDEIIPRVIPASLGDLEYDLLSKIYRLTLEKKPTVALFAPVFEQEIDPRMVQFYAQLGQPVPKPEKRDDFKFLRQILEHEGYQVRRIAFDGKEPVPEDADTLIVMGTEPLDERRRYEINKALYTGKSVLLALQAYNFTYEAGRGGLTVSANPIETGGNELLKSYGLEVDASFLMDENNQVVNISRGESQGIFQILTQQPVKLPIHIMLTDVSMNPDTSITSRLSSVFYLWGNALKLNEEKLKNLGLKSTVLLTTGPRGWTVPYHTGYLTNQDFASPPSVKGKLPVAVLLEGEFPNAFEGKERPAWPEKRKGPGFEEKDEKEKETAEKPFTDEHKAAKLLVIGGGDLFKDNVIAGRTGNMPLFINGVDALTLGEDLIRIRGKKFQERRIGKVEKGQKLTYRFLGIALVPLVFALIGITRWFLKRRGREAYLRAVGGMR